MGHMRAAANIMLQRPEAELLWASPREVLNVFHADEAGCHIITVTEDLLNKLSLIGKDLREYSLETVQMFYDDACMSSIESLVTLVGAGGAAPGAGGQLRHALGGASRWVPDL